MINSSDIVNQEKPKIYRFSIFQFAETLIREIVPYIFDWDLNIWYILKYVCSSVGELVSFSSGTSKKRVSKKFRKSFSENENRLLGE